MYEETELEQKITALWIDQCEGIGPDFTLDCTTCKCKVTPLWIDIPSAADIEA